MIGYNQTIVKQYIQGQFPKADYEYFNDIIDQCVELKMNCYFKFLVTKIQLVEIKHRKIVQKLFKKYIPQQKLQINYRDLIDDNQENNYMKYLGEIMKKLPSNLHDLTLIVNEYNLGGSLQILKHLGDCLKQTVNLRHLNLDLQDNYFKGNMRYLGEVFKKYLNNLQHLELNLSMNEIGSNIEYMQNLVLLLKWLPDNLLQFYLDISCNGLENNEDNLKYIADGFKYLPQDLQGLRLELQYNYCDGRKENLNQMGAFIKQLPVGLQYLEMDLSGNSIMDENKENIKYLRDGIKLLPKNLKHLILAICENIMEEDNEYFLQQLGEIIKYIPSELQYLELALSGNYLEENDIQKFKDNNKQIFDKLKEVVIYNN